MVHNGEPWKRLGDGTLITEDPDEGLGHIVPFSTYVKVLVTLLFLTIVTVWVANFDLGESVNATIALSIASLKAFLVVSFFMHLKFEKSLIVGYALYPLALLVLLIGGTMGDLATRPGVTPAGKDPLPSPLVQPQDKVGKFEGPHHGKAHDEEGNAKEAS